MSYIVVLVLRVPLHELHCGTSTQLMCPYGSCCSSLVAARSPVMTSDHLKRHHYSRTTTEVSKHARSMNYTSTPH